MKAAKEEKEKAIADVKAVSQREKEFAVAHARSREQVESARKIAELRHRYYHPIYANVCHDAT